MKTNLAWLTIQGQENWQLIWSAVHITKLAPPMVSMLKGSFKMVNFLFYFLLFLKSFFGTCSLISKKIYKFLKRFQDGKFSCAYWKSFSLIWTKNSKVILKKILSFFHWKIVNIWQYIRTLYSLVTDNTTKQVQGVHKSKNTQNYKLLKLKAQSNLTFQNVFLTNLFISDQFLQKFFFSYIPCLFGERKNMLVLFSFWTLRSAGE